MDLRLIASAYGIIFIAELPDKTALASLVLATENPPVPVFIGASVALTVQSLLAVAFGSSLSFCQRGRFTSPPALCFWGRRSPCGGEAWMRSSKASTRCISDVPGL